MFWAIKDASCRAIKKSEGMFLGSALKKAQNKISDKNYDYEDNQNPDSSGNFEIKIANH